MTLFAYRCYLLTDAQSRSTFTIPFASTSSGYCFSYWFVSSLCFYSIPWISMNGGSYYENFKRRKLNFSSLATSFSEGTRFFCSLPPFTDAEKNVFSKLYKCKNNGLSFIIYNPGLAPFQRQSVRQFFDQRNWYTLVSVQIR